MKQQPFTLIHVLGCALIAVLLAYIICEKTTDYDDLLFQKANTVFTLSSKTIRQVNEEIYLAAQVEISAYQTSYYKRIDSMFLNIGNQTNMLFALVERLKIERTPALAAQLQEAILQYQAIRADSNIFRKETIENLSAWPTGNWIIEAQKTKAPSQFEAFLNGVMVDLALTEERCFLDLAMHVSFDGWFDRYEPVMFYTPINPGVGDTVHLTVFLSPVEGQLFKQHIDYTLNGQKLSHHFGNPTSFRIRFNKPGLHPLHITGTQINWRTGDTTILNNVVYWRQK